MNAKKKETGNACQVLLPKEKKLQRMLAIKDMVLLWQIV